MSQTTHRFPAGAVIRPKRSAWGLALGLLLALAPLGRAEASREAAPGLTRDSGLVALAADLGDHILTVSVMVNHRGPFRMMVDTGCSLTVVSPNMARAVQANRAPADASLIVATNGLGNDTDAEEVVFDSLDLGGAHFEQVPAAVSASFDALSAVHGQRIDGALGYPLFRELYLTLDFPHHRILLSPQWPEGLPPLRTSLAIDVQADVPFVTVQIQGKPVEVMVDTGANQTLGLPTDLAQGFAWKVAPRAGPMLAVIGQTQREGIGRLAGSLFLGEAEQIEPATDVSTGPPSIGLRALQPYCVVFHPAENRMWICRDSPAPVPAKPEQSLGLSLYANGGGWRVAAIIPGSPAETAHVVPGNLITEIEGRPARDWTRDQLQRWIESHANVSLLVTDGAAVRALTLPVWNLVP